MACGGCRCCPPSLFTVLITQVPFVMSIWYSLTDWKIVPPTPREFVGLENYTSLVDDQFFRDAAWVSVVMTVVVGARSRSSSGRCSPCCSTASSSGRASSARC